MPEPLLNSPEFLGLSGIGVKLAMHFAAKYNGRNNGDLSCAFSEMKGRGWASSETLARAIRELLRTGFLLKTRQGGKNQCSLYAVTWWKIDASDKYDAALGIKATAAPPNTWRRNSLVRNPNEVAPTTELTSFDNRTNPPAVSSGIELVSPESPTQLVRNPNTFLALPGSGAAVSAVVEAVSQPANPGRPLNPADSAEEKARELLRLAVPAAKVAQIYKLTEARALALQDELRATG
jgi:hypothetical protein